MNELPPLPHWCEAGSPFARQMQAYARAAIEAEKLRTDKLLLASVPERWKSCVSPVGAVQSYIAEIEAVIEARKVPDGWQPTADNINALPAPESCTGVERSLWDVATMAAGDAIRQLSEDK